VVMISEPEIHDEAEHEVAMGEGCGAGAGVLPAALLFADETIGKKRKPSSMPRVSAPPASKRAAHGACSTSGPH